MNKVFERPERKRYKLVCRVKFFGGSQVYEVIPCVSHLKTDLQQLASKGYGLGLLCFDALPFDARVHREHYNLLVLSSDIVLAD